MASFTALPGTGSAPLSVQFQDLSTGDVTGWSWTFGDGGSSTQPNPVHVYQQNGDYTVSLTVSGPEGSDSDTKPGVVQVRDLGDCTAGNARNNTSAFKLGYDFIPVNASDTLGMYVVYSGKGAGLSHTVNIFMLPLEGNEVLIFGAGYGDIPQATNSAAFDADAADECLQACMGYDPASTVLRFVAPHGHVDHINPFFVDQLQAKGYTVAEIVFHQGDEQTVNNTMPWDGQDVGLFRTITGSSCNQEILSYDSSLGKIWVHPALRPLAGVDRPVLDVLNDPADRVLLLGSAAGGACPTPPSGIQATYQAHGTAVLR